jgi:hypothetical protein
MEDPQQIRIHHYRQTYAIEKLESNIENCLLGDLMVDN